MECPGGIAGTRLHIDGLDRTFTDALVRVDYADGTEFVTDSSPTRGIDHLLFVLALLLIIDSRRKLVGTITAFTLAHNVTLALASLGYVSLPGPPVEAVIA